jgi:hypothetical protein
MFRGHTSRPPCSKHVHEETGSLLYSVHSVQTSERLRECVNCLEQSSLLLPLKMFYFLVFRIDWSSGFPFSFFLSVGDQMGAD